MTHNDTARLARARGYPYACPAESYLWKDGATLPFDANDRAGRTPVLAFGSNRSPERLQQKFGHLGSHAIPVERAWLRDFDVVYAAHITTYGAVPAMLQHQSGVTVEISVTWLDDDQLTVMHASEMAVANYAYARLDNVELRLDGGGTADEALCYVGARGHLPTPQAAAHPLAAVRATGRNSPAFDTPTMLEAIRHRLARDQDPDAFVLRMIDDHVYRSEITAAISNDAVPFSYPATILEGRILNL
ncbi:MAG: hypothetical protein RIM33_06010 [Alphaproteobacteria bacterium]